MKCPVEPCEQLIIDGPDPDFSEYMWMADDLEEFDRQVEEEIMSDLMELEMLCYQEIYLNEVVDEVDDREWWCLSKDTSLTLTPVKEQASEVHSKLNPLAPEFYPHSYIVHSVEEEVQR